MIDPGLCHSFKHELLAMEPHRVTDTYMMALYRADAAISPYTRSYTTRGEVEGQGYAPGGIELTGLRAGLDGTVGYLTFDGPNWPSATITAQGALIYNKTRGNRTLAVLLFTDDDGKPKNVISSNGTFVVTLPPEGSTSMISIGDPICPPDEEAK